MTNLVRYAQINNDKDDRFFGRRRIQLLWQAGRRGKPGINADILNATESTRMLADPDFEVLGTNMTSALVTRNAEGGLTFTTAGADGDGAILLPHLDTNQSAWTAITWGTDRQVRWECDFETGSSIANTIIWAGLKLTNTPTVATDADQVFVRYEDDVNSGKLQFVVSIGGTDTTVDTGIALAASTRYQIRIEIDENRKATITIVTAAHATAVYRSAALTDAIDLIPYIGVEADGAAAAKAITIFGQGISREPGA